MYVHIYFAALLIQQCISILLLLSDEDDSDDEKSVGQVVVEGCGTANGTYKKMNETHGGAPVYEHRKDSNKAVAFVIRRLSRKWYIERETRSSNIRTAMLYYESSDNATLRTPPKKGWRSVLSGQDPPPTCRTCLVEDLT